MQRASLWTAVRAQLYAPSKQELTSDWPPGSVQVVHEVKDMPVAVSAQAGACTGERISFCGGAQLGWRGTWAWSSGELLFGNQTSRSDAFLFGLFGMVAAKLPYSLEARAQLVAVGAAGDRGFTLQLGDQGGTPVNQTVAVPPRFELGLTLGLARQVP